ncbi:MAG: hypothetical protein ACHQ2Z_05720 [Elusimicrobiota bacterium]
MVKMKSKAGGRAHDLRPLMVNHISLLICALILALAAAPGRAEEASQAPDAAKGDVQKQFSFDPKVRFLSGNQDYNFGEARLDIGLPYGLQAVLDFSAYEIAGTSWTPTITFGAGENWGNVSVSGTYAVTTLANNYNANAVDIAAETRAGSDDIVSTVGGDVRIAHNFFWTRVANPKPGDPSFIEITQRTPTITLKQQLFSTRAEMAFSEYTYNVDIPATVKQLTTLSANAVSNVGTFRLNGDLGGVIAGFPDHSEKFSLFQDLKFVPVTLWGAYQSTHIIDTSLLTNGTADVEMFGAEINVKKVTATLEYQHVRQDKQIPLDQYGLSLSAQF